MVIDDFTFNLGLKQGSGSPYPFTYLTAYSNFYLSGRVNNSWGTNTQDTFNSDFRAAPHEVQVRP
jgi:hypothetical protein